MLVQLRIINLDTSTINLFWYGFVNDKKQPPVFKILASFIGKVCSSPNHERSPSCFYHCLSLSKWRCSSTKYKKAKWSKLSSYYHKYHLTRLLIFSKFILDRKFLFLSSLLVFLSQYLTTASNCKPSLWAVGCKIIYYFNYGMQDARCSCSRTKT